MEYKGYEYEYVVAMYSFGNVTSVFNKFSNLESAIDEVERLQVLNLQMHERIGVYLSLKKIENVGLSKHEKSKRIKEGFKKSDYVHKGRAPNREMHKRIKELHDKGISKNEIAESIGCGIATVYRILS